jgi:GNAT superfamily N-acetyltransferase
MRGYRITTHIDEMNLQVIHEFLANSYWSKGIPYSTLKRAIENSLSFGVLADQGEQVAFARMVTDRATYAYLADVFVVESHRGKGIAQWLVQTIMDYPDLQNLRRITLATRDAFGLYEKVGFTPLVKPQIFMEVWKPDVYQKIDS